MPGSSNLAQSYPSTNHLGRVLMSKLLISNRFEVTLQGTHGVVVPEEQAKPFAEAGHKRLRMTASFEGKSIEFHRALHNNKGRFMISFGKRYQKELGIYPSDYFELQLFEDTSEYGVEVPEEFSAVLESDYEAFERFKALSDGKKRSWKLVNQLLGKDGRKCFSPWLI